MKRKETTLQIVPLAPGLSIPPNDVPCQMLPGDQAQKFRRRLHQLQQLEQDKKRLYAQIPAKAHSAWLKTRAKNPVALECLLLLYFSQSKSIPRLKLPLEIVPKNLPLQRQRIILVVYNTNTSLAMVIVEGYFPVFMDLSLVGKFLTGGRVSQVEWEIKLSDLPGHKIALSDIGFEQYKSLTTTTGYKYKWALDSGHDLLWSTRFAKAVKSSHYLELLENHFLGSNSNLASDLGFRARCQRIKQNPALLNQILRECHAAVVARLGPEVELGLLGNLNQEKGNLVDITTLHHLLGLYKIARLVADKNCSDCFVLLEHHRIKTRLVFIRTTLIALKYASLELVPPHLRSKLDL